MLAISDNFQHLASIEQTRVQKYILIYDVDFVKGYNIYQYIFGIQLCSILEVVKNAETDIFSPFSSCLVSIFSSNVGHQEKIISKS